MPVAFAIAGRIGNRGGEAGDKLAAPDAADRRRLGVGRYAAIAYTYGRLADRDGAAHRGTEAPMLADEAIVVKGQALRLRLVAEPKCPEVETPRLALA